MRLPDYSAISTTETSWTRRDFLAGAAACTAAGIFSVHTGTSRADSGAKAKPVEVSGIERSTVFPGRKTGHTWFSPRACIVPRNGGHEALMTMQSITGSDYFGPTHFSTSTDLGKTWTKPAAVPGFGRTPLDSGYEVGVCDVVPEYHPQTDQVLAIGHNVYYKGGHLARPQRERWPVYTTRSADGMWSGPRKLEWDDPRGNEIYTSNCSQRITLENGDVLVPYSFGRKGRRWRSATTVLYAVDGTKLTERKVGNELSNKVGRGLLEPSLAAHSGRCFMTIRAEDKRGYVTASEDGLNWEPQKAWAWDDGTPLSMSTTQQRWLIHSDALFLVYTRKAENNTNVFRWRAPLFVAQVDLDNLRLIRDTEQTVFPVIGDGISNAAHVARLGNFHTTAVTADESWVTVGETLPNDGWAGDTMLARLRWNRPNRVAPIA